MQYCYEKQRGKNNMALIEIILYEIKPEKNVIIQNFEELNLQSKNAWDSQALIQLKTMYCNQKNV